jgi:hypothetical protein
MDRQGRVGLIFVCLLLVPLGLEIYAVWPVLATHLNALNWMTLALSYLPALFGLGSLLIDARNNAHSRTLALAVTICVILSWAISFSLMGKIGH